ncbi:hypothetical protein [Paenibacillus tundrae]
MIEEHVFVTDEQLKDYFELNRQQAMRDKRFMDYLCGYIAHIYTDRVWTFNVYPPYETPPDGRKIHPRCHEAGIPYSTGGRRKQLAR